MSVQTHLAICIDCGKWADHEEEEDDDDEGKANKDLQVVWTFKLLQAGLFIFTHDDKYIMYKAIKNISYFPFSQILTLHVHNTYTQIMHTYRRT